MTAELVAATSVSKKPFIVLRVDMPKP